MSEIILTDPVPGNSDLERLHLFAGRHLGEEEFERQQAYVDRRMAPLLGSVSPGVVHGLHVRTQRSDRAGEGFNVSPGLAVAGNGQALGLYYPLRERWTTLIEDYLAETSVVSAAGIYYLILRRASRYVDTDPSASPCQRDEFDPTRDARRLVIGSLGLKRLAISPQAVATNSRELIENWVAANHVDADFLHAMKHAVPLGLLAIEHADDDAEGNPVYSVNWFSEAAGRYRSITNSGYHVLLRQVSEAFRRILLQADRVVDDTTSVQDFIRDNMRLDFLPASGELPLEILQAIASTTPSISWLPNHLGIDLVAVPEESVSELIERHLPRRPIDLRSPAADRLRLLLAVNEPDYKTDLLDYPQTDKKLQSDIFRYFMRTYDAWREWMREFDHLYALLEENVLDEDELKSLDLPEPVAAPQLPQDFYTQIIDESVTEIGNDDNDVPLYPYSEGVPDYPRFYHDWGRVDTTVPGRPVLPPVLEEPSEDGLVIKYTVARVELEALDNEIREIRSRVEKTRDYLLLQRQQLDSQTVSLAALAGGVAGDGSGLQVARWLPFTKFTQPDPDTDGSSTPSIGDGDTTPQAVTTTKSYELINPGYMNNTATSALFDAQVKRETKAVNARESVSSSVLKNNNLVYASTLRKTPTVFSTMQFNLNNIRLDKIAKTPKQALTKPAFEAKEFRFGVLEQIRPEVQEYKKAVRGMTELLTTLDGMFDVTEAKAIKKQLNKYGKPKSLEDLEIKEGSTRDDQQDKQSSILYEALFDAGKILIKQIAYVEGRYARQEARLEGKLRARIRKEGEIEKLIALIRKSTEELESLDKRRIEYLGDYGVAQRLLDEDWLTVYQHDQERTRVLTTGLKGLYYVRVRQTPVSLPLADPLELRYGKASDLVPGCDWVEDPELPEEIEDFFDTVMEIPMNDWSPLKDLKVYVPPVKRMKYIAAMRSVRIRTKSARKYRTRMNARPVKVSLLNVHMQTQSVLSQMASKSFPVTISSQKIQQEETANVLSLEDVLSGTKGHLQKQGQILRNRLEQAVACLLEKLNELPPSARLQWAQLAEDDRLHVERVEQWPGLERAERDDFNAVRTVAELVAWWFRQIDTKASSEGRSAMRNMIRAVVIHAALGDPNEILHGEVHVPPRRLALGEPLRLRLNRAANPGTLLHLMDPQQRIVAMLKVSDNDQTGTVASVVRVTKRSASINTRYRVVASKLTRHMKF